MRRRTIGMMRGAGWRKLKNTFKALRQPKKKKARDEEKRNGRKRRKRTSPSRKGQGQ
jgi:hypothetical protein